MNYKISTYVLLVVLAGFIIYACGDSGKTDDSGNTNGSVQSTPTPSTEFSYLELTPELAALLRGQRMDRSSGALVSPAEAREDLKRLQDSIGIKCDPATDPRVIYGFTFGMNNFKAFADQVAELDKNSGNKLMGVRVYMSLKYKEISGKNQIYNDVFLVPLDEKGNDLFDIDPCKINAMGVLNNGPVLNTSVPCPNQCQ